MVIYPRKFLTKAILLSACLSIISACDNSLTVPNVHLPSQELSKELLRNHVLAYCWQYPEGRVSQNDQQDKEVVIVLSSGDGLSTEIIRDPDNLSADMPSFYVDKAACVRNGNSIRYITDAIVWRPFHNAITFTSGSDPFLTDFDYYEIGENLEAAQKEFPITRKEYGGYFGEPQGIFWSPDGQRVATLGIDVGIESSGANIWVVDATDKSLSRITPFRDIGEFVVNASWSQNGQMLAIGYGEAGGVGIAEFTQDFSYTEITSTTNSQIRKWPYTYENLFNFILNRHIISYNSYLYSVSHPVWVNHDNQIIFTAADEENASTLFIVNADGSNVEKLLPQLTGNMYLPKLSPNGQILAFVRYPGWKDRSRVEIGVVDLLTKKVESLVVMPAPKNGSDLIISGLAWSPDAEYLAFSSNHQGESDIYIISADGGGWLNFTEEIHGNAVSPVWRP